MKIHTKHLALCEKGGKFNKTHNMICKLQEELIEPAGKMEGLFKFIFVNFCYIFGTVVAGAYVRGLGAEIYFLSQNEVQWCVFIQPSFSTQIISHAARDVSTEVFPKLMVALGQHHR